MIPYNPYLALACAVVVAVVPFVQGFELVALTPRDLLFVGVLNVAVSEIQRRMGQPAKRADPDRLTAAQTRQVADELERRMKATPKGGG